MSRSEWRFHGESDREPLPYTECGLDDVYLHSGYDRVKTPYGEGIAVKCADELHKAIAWYLVTERKVLKGKEIRFLRKQMELTQAELGRRMRLSDQQVARWEKGESELSGPADTLLRLWYVKHLGAKIDPLALVEELMAHDAPIKERAEFEKTAEGWKPLKAA
jgi:DNA-binding transcriptional regulator YiaG